MPIPFLHPFREATALRGGELVHSYSSFSPPPLSGILPSHTSTLQTSLSSTNSPERGAEISSWLRHGQSIPSRNPSVPTLIQLVMHFQVLQGVRALAAIFLTTQPGNLNSGIKMSTEKSASPSSPWIEVNMPTSRPPTFTEGNGKNFT